ncbi:MAG: 23S rRNA (guanosine(2251)-2'-O)-methyltransferase RlmB [Alphaproteobacteria bacterium]|jgi:23S rRNA (guanosine2251-2'-O)-methyltransferase|nr:23S rRNA (guanosine(2251)-2'-O)-methyltransferase RlmB [Alphaproteobacteria bacterium]
MSTRKRSNKRNHRPGSGPEAGPDSRQNRAKKTGENPNSGSQREIQPESAQKERGNWLFGTHAVMAALANPNRKCNRLLVTTDVLRRMEAELRDIVPSNVFVEKSDRGTISSLLAPDSVHQGIALDCQPLENMALEDVLARHKEGDSIVVVLDQITDPHNVGAILRSAAGFGAHAVIMQDRNAPPLTGTLAKSASGALELLPLVRVTNLARTLEQLANNDYWRIGLDASAKQTLAQSQPGKRTALVMGAEGSGLRRLTAEKCDLLCRLPMVEAARLTSLNVSNAAAIALYELVRT